jgi:RNA polymerase sigma factor (sigma-70 family)
VILLVPLEGGQRVGRLALTFGMRLTFGAQKAPHRTPDPFFGSFLVPPFFELSTSAKRKQPLFTAHTRILSAIEAGDPQASANLLPMVYEELRRLAAAHMKREKPGQTLDATALVHEAYLRLVASPGLASLASPGCKSGEASLHWNSRAHFFAAAAEAMRRILIDNARRKRRPKYGGDLKRVDLDQAAAVAESSSESLLALDEALDKLNKEEPVKAEVVKLRYFAGLSIDEAAELLGISRATVKRHWAYARAWLFCEMNGKD